MRRPNFSIANILAPRLDGFSMAQKKRPGRPKAKPADRRSVTLSFRVKPTEAALIRAAAAHKGYVVTRWMRWVLVEKAGKFRRGR